MCDVSYTKRGKGIVFKSCLTRINKREEKKKQKRRVDDVCDDSYTRGKERREM